ncbi:hypothetical protein THAOC_21314 [Thalassiosira oceanica]|uniref:Uncharacterized protein n=1 Tax=Thalassiosira oceanica TaxID=159749 RepID=K0RZR3_THAOC|nr:hypothetical protein THAOC_21314 [Thalassiosira oceanica]|eukprot:EJK58550.1 hypothetical protein THAOC_21314 [Thalassiosira oceanica]
MIERNEFRGQDVARVNRPKVLENRCGKQLAGMAKPLREYCRLSCGLCEEGAAASSPAADVADNNEVTTAAADAKEPDEEAEVGLPPMESLMDSLAESSPPTPASAGRWMANEDGTDCVYADLPWTMATSALAHVTREECCAAGDPGLAGPCPDEGADEGAESADETTAASDSPPAETTAASDSPPAENDGMEPAGPIAEAAKEGGGQEQTASEPETEDEGEQQAAVVVPGGPPKEEPFAAAAVVEAPERPPPPSPSPPQPQAEPMTEAELEPGSSQQEGAAGTPAPESDFVGGTVGALHGRFQAALARLGRRLERRRPRRRRRVLRQNKGQEPLSVLGHVPERSRGGRHGRQAPGRPVAGHTWS